MLSHVLGAVDKTSSSFSAHGKIGNFIFIIINTIYLFTYGISSPHSHIWFSSTDAFTVLVQFPSSLGEPTFIRVFSGRFAICCTPHLTPHRICTSSDKVARQWRRMKRRRLRPTRKLADFTRSLWKKYAILQRLQRHVFFSYLLGQRMYHYAHNFTKLPYILWPGFKLLPSFPFSSENGQSIDSSMLQALSKKTT